MRQLAHQLPANGFKELDHQPMEQHQLLLQLLTQLLHQLLLQSTQLNHPVFAPHLQVLIPLLLRRLATKLTSQLLAIQLSACGLKTLLQLLTQLTKQHQFATGTSQLVLHQLKLTTHAT